MKRLLIFILILLFVGGGFLYIRNRQNNPSGEKTTSVFKDFFPLSGNSSSEETSSSDTTIPAVGETQTPSSRSSFTQITSNPVAGYTHFSLSSKVIDFDSEKNIPVEKTVVDTVVRYVSRQSGFVYEIKNTETPLQITNLFIPNVYESFFSDNNQTVIHRFLRDDGQTIATYSLPIPPETVVGSRVQKQGVFFTDNISNLIPLENSVSVAYLIPRSTGGSSLFTATSTDTKRKEIFRSPLRELLLFTTKKGDIYAQTKASNTTPGYLYKIDQVNRKFIKVLGDISGLTASVSPNGTYILYSQSIQNGFRTFLLNTATGTSTPVGLSILPEKCVWLLNEDLICGGTASVPQGGYPDSWYQGLVSFTDSVYRIYSASNTFDVLEEQSLFDMTALQADEDKGLLYFIDKQTGILWKLSY